MELGDAVEKITKAAGMKPCGGCKERQAKLNDISRRGFVGGAVFAFLLAKNAVLKAAWRAVGAELPQLDWSDVGGFIRTANTMQHKAYLETGAHLDKIDMLAAVASHRSHFDPTHPAYVWMSQFTPAAKEIIPGWTLDFVLRPEGLTVGDYHFDNGYTFTLKSSRVVIIADETGYFVKALTPATMPDLTSLPKAAAFPGAVGYEVPLPDNEAPPATAWQRIKNFFTPRTVYAQLNCCLNASNCKSCGCGNCLCSCCDVSMCSNTPPGPNTCFFNANCTGFQCVGQVINCGWYYTNCGDQACNCCAKLKATCCTAANPCTPTRCPEAGGGCL